MSTAIRNDIREQKSVKIQTGVGPFIVSFYRVRTVTFCLLKVGEAGTEYFDFAKCHTRDHDNGDVGKRKALGRALRQTAFNRRDRLHVVEMVFPPVLKESDAMIEPPQKWPHPTARPQITTEQVDAASGQCSGRRALMQG